MTKLKKTQLGYMGQQLTKAFIESKEREPTETEANFIQEVGFFLGIKTSNFNLHYLNKLEEEKKQIRIKELETELNKLKGGDSQ
jgi:hypothetical protein